MRRRQPTKKHGLWADQLVTLTIGKLAELLGVQPYQAVQKLLTRE